VEQDLPSAPTNVIAFGTSMGGLISALEAENSSGRIDGALTTCGIVAGAVQLNDYQLDGESALSQLLATPVKLVGFTSTDDGVQTGNALTASAVKAHRLTASRDR
jgi:alpha-beta hydrolase superfamily lysophospholipase